jgi:NADPH-dependent ferric siderophore reductase
VAPEFIDRFALRAHVTDIEQPAARTRLIRVAGPALEDLYWIPGQQVRVLVNGPLEHWGDLLRTTLRTYSVWSYEGGRLELCVYEHAEDGPGTHWAADLHVGDEVSFRRPEGRFVLDPAARLSLPGKAEITWVDRGEASAANSTLLVEALRAARLPQTPGIAYVAGEARTCQAVRTHLVRDRGWPRRSVIVKPFWTPGKRGME